MINFKPAKIKRQEAVGMEELMSSFLKQSGLYGGLYRKAVFDAWDKVSGLSNYTTNKFLKDNVLYITVSSSALRSRLCFQLAALKDAVNAELSANSLLTNVSGTDVKTAEILEIKLK